MKIHLVRRRFVLEGISDFSHRGDREDTHDEVASQGEMKKLKRDCERRARVLFSEYRSGSAGQYAIDNSIARRDVTGSMRYPTWRRARYGFDEYRN